MKDVAAETSRLHCSGSLISETHVLTSAHCFKDHTDNLEIFTILLGSERPDQDESYEPERTERKIEQLYIHPNYTNNAYFDIAVVKIAKVDFCIAIYPICLPESPQPVDHRALHTATVVGYGPDPVRQSNNYEVVLTKLVVQILLPNFGSLFRP